MSLPGHHVIGPFQPGTDSFSGTSSASTPLAFPMGAPKDSIMAATAAFKADPREDGVSKLNLGIGVCQNSDGECLVPKFIQEVLSSSQFLQAVSNAGYLPGIGHQGFLTYAQRLVFGETLTTNHVGSVQSIGGTNSLYLILSALINAQYDGATNPFHNATVFIPNPTWGNHKLIPLEAGFGPRGVDPKKNPHIQEYPYLNDLGDSVDFDALYTFVASRNEACIFILHASCHNPSGVDLTQDQWDLLINLIKAKQDEGISIKPVFDCAYQGFGAGLDEDVYAIRKAHELGVSGCVGESYSKKLSLYSHRLGAAHVFSPHAEEVEAYVSIMSNISQRGSGSSCPLSGAAAAHMVLGDTHLMEMFSTELQKKRLQFEKTRAALSEATGIDLRKSKGMFAFIPVADDSFGERLWSEFGLQTITLQWKKTDGEIQKALRVCLDPVNQSNLKWVTDAFHTVFKS